MKTEIIQHINQLESQQGIKILLAVESGSRAWGCPSPDSDYDIRIVFVRPQSDYLNIDDKPDTIDYFHGELLDINGWDIKKAFKLIRKSNATPFEWAQSPIAYKEIDSFSKTLLDLSKKYFQPVHSLNHYRGIAKNSYLSKNDDGKLKLKTLFYILRPLMAARWIIEKNAVPPMDLPKLMTNLKQQNITDRINELLALKEGVNEDYVHQLESLMTDFIEGEFEFINSAKIIESENVLDSSELNVAFQKYMY